MKEAREWRREEGGPAVAESAPADGGPAAGLIEKREGTRDFTRVQAAVPTAEDRVDPGKLAVVGTGLVGSTFAYTVMLRGLVREMVLIDVNREKAQGDAMDLNHGLSFVSPVRITAGGMADCAGAGVIVIAAGVAQKPGESRMDLLRRNAAIFREVVGEIARHNRRAVILVATNPVDVLTYAAWRYSGYPSRRVIGSGTILDTARLRFSLGQYLGLDPRNVHAYIIGEHGDSELPAWSLADAAGMNVRRFAQEQGIALDDHDLERIFFEVRDAAYEIIRRKGATHYAIALGLARIVESIVRDERSVLSVSTLLRGYHGIEGVCLGVPAVIGREGVERVVELPLAAGEMEALRRSAEVVHRAIGEAGLGGAAAAGETAIRGVSGVHTGITGAAPEV